MLSVTALKESRSSGETLWGSLWFVISTLNLFRWKKLPDAVWMDGSGRNTQDGALRYADSGFTAVREEMSTGRVMWIKFDWLNIDLVHAIKYFHTKTHVTSVSVTLPRAWYPPSSKEGSDGGIFLWKSLTSQKTSILRLHRLKLVWWKTSSPASPRRPARPLRASAGGHKRRTPPPPPWSAPPASKKFWSLPPRSAPSLPASLTGDLATEKQEVHLNSETSLESQFKRERNCESLTNKQMVTCCSNTKDGAVVYIRFTVWRPFKAKVVTSSFFLLKTHKTVWSSKQPL